MRANRAPSRWWKPPRRVAGKFSQYLLRLAYRVTFNARARSNLKKLGIKLWFGRCEAAAQRIPCHEEELRRLQLVFNFKLEDYPKTGFVNSRYNFGASALSKL